MRRMFLLFSHTLTKEQIEDAEVTLKVNEFVYLPKDLQEKFSNVPPNIEDIVSYSKIFISYLEKNLKKNDIVLIQGDFGVVYNIVEFCKRNGIIAVYSTTARVSKEKEVDGKIIKVSEFRHIKFRKYF